MSTCIVIDMDELQETWERRGDPVLIRQRWSRYGIDLDDDSSVEVFCATCEDNDVLVELLVDLASMSEEVELNRRAHYPAAILGEMWEDESV